MELLGHRGIHVSRGLLLLTASAFVVSLFSFLASTSFAFDSDEPDQTPAGSGINLTDPIPPEINKLEIFKPKRITITFITEPISGMTYGITVKDVLEDFGVQINRSHVVTPGPDFVITDGMMIKIIEVTTEEKSELVSVPFESITVLDDTREIDTTTVVQSGSAGMKELTYQYTYVNGILQSKDLVDEVEVNPPQNEIIALGTKRIFRDMTINGDAFSYWRVMRVFATSYDAFCLGCNQWTALGAIVQKGVCAVDPTVIPLRSNFYVPGYGFCTALDVGGAIKGNRIDLGFADLSLVQGQWSARYVDIYLLD